MTKGSGEEGKWWRREMVTLVLGRKPEHETKPCIFPCKVAAGGDERYLLCVAGAAAVVLVPPLCSATSGCSCVRSSIRFLNRGCRSHWTGCMIVVI